MGGDALKVYFIWTKLHRKRGRRQCILRVSESRVPSADLLCQNGEWNQFHTVHASLHVSMIMARRAWRMKRAELTHSRRTSCSITRRTELGHGLAWQLHSGRTVASFPMIQRLTSYSITSTALHLDWWKHEGSSSSTKQATITDGCLIVTRMNLSFYQISWENSSSI